MHLAQRGFKLAFGSAAVLFVVDIQRGLGDADAVAIQRPFAGALGAFVYDMTTGALNKDPDAAFCEDGAQACES